MAARGGLLLSLLNGQFPYCLDPFQKDGRCPLQLAAAHKAVAQLDIRKSRSEGPHPFRSLPHCRSGLRHPLQKLALLLRDLTASVSHWLSFHVYFRLRMMVWSTNRLNNISPPHKPMTYCQRSGKPKPKQNIHRPKVAKMASTPIMAIASTHFWRSFFTFFESFLSSIA